MQELNVMEIEIVSGGIENYPEASVGGRERPS